MSRAYAIVDVVETVGVSEMTDTCDQCGKVGEPARNYSGQPGWYSLSYVFHEDERPNAYTTAQVTHYCGAPCLAGAINEETPYDS